MYRRDFIRSAVGAGLLAGIPAGCNSQLAKKSVCGQRKATLNLSCQEIRFGGKDPLAEKVAKLEKWGAAAIELTGKDLPNRVKEIKDAIKGTNIKVSAVCVGYKGSIISDDVEARKNAAESIKEILAAAGELGATGLIVVPAFKKETKLDCWEARGVLVEQLQELGDYAAKQGTRIILEPLNRKEAIFLRLLADAAAICRDVNNTGVAMMGDFYHMNLEETSDMGAFLSAGKYLHHVHLASALRNLPGQDERSFIDGFRGLKMIGYQDYCSLECHIKGEADVEIPKSLRFLEEQWRQATI